MSYRIISLVLTLMLSAGLFVTSALAGYGSSAIKTVTVYGYTYEIIDYIHNETSGGVDYQTTAWPKTATSVPLGYMGTKGRIYDLNGDLAEETEWDYNMFEGNTSCLNGNTYFPPSGTGFYYSWGQAEFFNGSGYTRYNSNRTPNFSPGRAYIPTQNNISVQQNERGEIYGSALFLSELGIEPDLISAVNPDGVTGYLRAEDVAGPKINSPEEAIAYMQNKQPRTIPMYASDGVTVVGTFTIG